MTKQLRKLTFQTFRKPNSVNLRDSVHMIDFVGVIDSCEYEVSASGEYPVFHGKFIGKSPNGERAFSKKLVPPVYIGNRLRKLVEELGQPLCVGYRVNTEVTDYGPVGFVYTIQELVEPQRVEDPLFILDEVLESGLTLEERGD